MVPLARLDCTLLVIETIQMVQTKPPATIPDNVGDIFELYNPLYKIYPRPMKVMIARLLEGVDVGYTTPLPTTGDRNLERLSSYD